MVSLKLWCCYGNEGFFFKGDKTETDKNQFRNIFSILFKSLLVVTKITIKYSVFMCKVFIKLSDLEIKKKEVYASP